jgi:hypothetical protein
MKATLVCCLLLAFCMSASAQTDKMKSSDSMKGKKSSMTGCVMEKDGHMMMANKEHPDGMMMSGMDMKDHVGHMMKVTGMMMTDDKGMMMMNVQSMKMMKGSCGDMGMKHDDMKK